MLVLLLASASSVLAAGKKFPLTFTGAATDFPIQGAAESSFLSGIYPILNVDDNDVNGVPQPDVGLPPGFPYSVSGWDIKQLRFAYDYANDILSSAIISFEVNGDADGDGDPAHTSAALAARGGQDFANFQDSESCAIALDIGNGAGSNAPDGVFDFIVGYPAEQNPNGNPYPCGAQDFGTTCFGLYYYDQSLNTKQISQRLVYKDNDPILSTAFSFAVDHIVPTSKAKPTLEWSITQFTQLYTLFGEPPIDKTGSVPFSINVAAFCGSFVDDGIGEDNVPNSAPFVTITWPCFKFDACDICGGDGTTCLDCKGIANGPNKYDICDVCGGNGGRDCAGVPCGTTTYDVCDVCGGSGTTCLDCKGTPFGKAAYDACDICGGNGQSCLDCAGVPFGTKTYDTCDVCNGDGQSCLDCLGVPFGTAQYDICGVCNGPGTACIQIAPPRDYCAPKDPNVCGFFPGDVFDIQLLDLNSNAYNLIGGDAATFCVGERGYLAIGTVDGNLFQRWSQQLDGSYLVTDVGSDKASTGKSFLQCTASFTGKYTLSWDEFCETATINLKQDPCTIRRSAISTATLKRRRCRKENEVVYEIGEHTTWTGIQNDTTLERFWLNFCPFGAFLATAGQSGQESFVFGDYQTAQGVVTLTDRFSDPPGLACTQTGDYDIDYEYLPRTSDPYWDGREGHNRIPSIPELTTSVQSSPDDIVVHSEIVHPRFGQFRKELEAPSSDDDDDDSSTDFDSAQRSAVESRREQEWHFDRRQRERHTVSSSSSRDHDDDDDDDDDEHSHHESHHGRDRGEDRGRERHGSYASRDHYRENSSSKRHTDRRSDDFFLRKRNELVKRNDVNRYQPDRAVAVLRTARIAGRVVDKCVQRAALLTGKVVREVDLCNGDIPVECFPERPPCDEGDETVDGYHHHCVKKPHEPKQNRHHRESSSERRSYYRGFKVEKQLGAGEVFQDQVAAVLKHEANEAIDRSGGHTSVSESSIRQYEDSRAGRSRHHHRHDSSDKSDFGDRTASERASRGDRVITRFQ